jgi:hypothetical protein
MEVRDAGGEDPLLPGGCRQCRSCQLLDHLEAAVGASPLGAFPERRHPLPAGQERREHPMWHRLDLVTESGDGAAPDSAKDLGVAVLGVLPAWPELTDEQPARAHEPGQHADGDSGCQS